MNLFLAQCPTANGFIKWGMMPKKVGAANGGNSCMSCTMFIGILKNVMQVYNCSGEESIDMFCSVLPDIFYDACFAIKDLVIVVLANKLDSNDTADVICNSLTFCRRDPGHDYFDVCNLTAIRPVCVLFDLVDEDYTAKSDDDGDRFNCSDGNLNYYPGRIPIDYDRENDSNCNGIYGVNPETGNPYEMELCEGQDNFGTIVFGDSIGAHFHIPPDWFRADVVNAELLENLTYVVGNEADWPHLSYGTGHVNSTWPVTINSPTNSIYWRNRNRNLCSHNDYQNLAFNGASSIVCPGWTNTNATKQQIATNHAAELSNALKELSNSVSFSRFDVHYLDSPLDRGAAEWTGELWELIEPIDGLHPSKNGQDMFAQVIWEEILEQFPEILGAVNPNNDLIRQIFGDQNAN
ncbi:hypothetical protein CHUAL_002744 [Chamberlinius hualienensis]